MFNERSLQILMFVKVLLVNKDQLLQMTFAIYQLWGKRVPCFVMLCSVSVKRLLSIRIMYPFPALLQ
jgi:hypothetical protein